MVPIDILQLVDKLEELLENSKRLPLSRMVVVDEDAVLNIIDQLRIALPQEIRQAKELQLDRDRCIGDAQREAGEILAQARAEAIRQISESDLFRAAEARADAILRAAQQEAESIRAGADEYAVAKLRELANWVAELEVVIRNGLNTLEGRSAGGEADEGEQPDERLGAVRIAASRNGTRRPRS